MTAFALLSLLGGKFRSLRHRSPIYVAVRKREEAREWNAFVIGVDYGRLKTTMGEPIRLRDAG